MSWDHRPDAYPDPALRAPVATFALHPFRRGPRLPRLIVLGAIAIGYLAIRTHAPLVAIAAVYGALAVVAAAAVVLRRRGLVERPPIVVGTDAIELPAGAFTTRTRT